MRLTYTFAAVLILASSANAALQLSIKNMEPFDQGIMDFGLCFSQGFTINIWSNNDQPYNAYLGVSRYGSLQGTLSLVTITPDAGDLSWADDTWDNLDYSGFALGTDGPSETITPGVHFIFGFVYDQNLGWDTNIVLLDSDATTIIAGIHVYDIPEPTSLILLVLGVPFLSRKFTA